MPSRLLLLLTDTPRSGDELGQELGVGRVTVNTLARRLQEDGVPLHISRAGYALQAGTPAPKLVPLRGHFGRALEYHGTVTSTQDVLRFWADAEQRAAPHGAVVVAERQTAGRGRRGRAWDTSGGTLVFSLLLRRGGGTGLLGLALSELALLPLASGVALHAACTALGVSCGLKWPNDLLTPDGRKLAGILLEADLRGEEARRVILGIGINVADAPAGAAYLRESAPQLTRAEVLTEVLAALEHWLSQPAAAVLDAWRAASLTLGQQVEVKTLGGVVSGLAQDIDAQGNLLIRTQDGSQTVNTGDVQLVMPEVGKGGIEDI